MKVHIRDFNPHLDYESVATLNNVNFPEFTWTADEIKHDDATRPTKCRSGRWVAECEGRIVGVAQYDQYANAYNPRKFSIEVLVDPACHNRGIGKHLYAMLIERLRGFEPLSLDAWSREDMACRIAFFEHRGYREDQRVWSSRLDLTTFDPAPHWSYVESLRAQGFTVRTLAELQQTGSLDEQQLYEAWTTLHDDVPIAPSQDRSSRTFEEWRPRNLDNPSLFPEAYFFVLDGDRIVATTQLWHSPDREGLRTGLTGVRRDYRGRGLAFALKVIALDFARRRGYRWTDTENASDNAGMLGINDRLGFVRRPAWLHYAGAWEVVASA